MVVFIENENDQPIESVFHQKIKSSLSMKNAIYSARGVGRNAWL